MLFTAENIVFNEVSSCENFTTDNIYLESMYAFIGEDEGYKTNIDVFKKLEKENNCNLVYDYLNMLVLDYIIYNVDRRLLQNLKNKNFDDLSLANRKIPNKYTEERDNLEELSDEDGNYPKDDNEIKEILISKKYEEMFKAFKSSGEVKIYSNDSGM